MPPFRTPCARLLSVLGFAIVVGCNNDSAAPQPPTPPVSKATGIAAIPASLFLQAGQSQRIEIEARDSAGVLTTAPVLTWRSDASSVASVDAAGLVNAIAPGSARVTAIAGNLSALVNVVVTAVAPGVAQWRTARAGLTDNTLLGIWDDGQGSTYGVGQNGTLLRSRNDGPWQLVPLNTQETLVGVWGSSPSDIWIVGTGGLILRGDGTTFTPVASGTTAALLEVWGLSATEVYAVGDLGTILRWDGTQWSRQQSNVSDDLWGIWAAGSSAVFVVGNNGVVLRSNGSAWQRVITPTVNPLFDVWGTSATNIFAVGTNGTILRFDGAAWTLMNTPGAANLFAMRGRAFNAAEKDPWLSSSLCLSPGRASGLLRKSTGSFQSSSD